MSMAKLKQSFRRTPSSTNVSTEVKLLDVGDEAPDFELKDEAGNVHKLSSFRGRRVILSFYRYAS
jgi:peroxiredoxin